MVYYRVVNTAMFIEEMATSFVFMDVLPLLIGAEVPLLWFVFYCLVLNKMLQKRLGKLALRWFINKIHVLFHFGYGFQFGGKKFGIAGLGDVRSYIYYFRSVGSIDYG